MNNDLLIKKLRIEDEELNIFQDPDPESPRDWDNLGKVVMFHKRYDFPNELKLRYEDFNGWKDLEKHLYENENAALVLPIFMLDHSGITIKCGSFNDPWDSGQVGFICAIREDVKKSFGIKRISKKTLRKIENILLNEIETFDKYLTGQVFGFNLDKITVCNLREEHKKTIDSCWGFYDIDDILNDLDKKWGAIKNA